MKNYRVTAGPRIRHFNNFNCKQDWPFTLPIMRLTNLCSLKGQMGQLLSVMFLYLFLIPFNLSAQVSCGGGPVSIFCLNNPSQTYECIDGDFDAPTLYGTQLLSALQAQSTPQYLIVKGKLTFTEDYTFATGSEIIFLDNNSGFRVFNNKKLTLRGSALHGCTKLWAGVEVLPSATIIAENCIFRDAKAAIILRSLTVIEATGNTFEKNLCGILALNANPLIISPISILLGNQKGISGNTFYGADHLLESIVPASIDPGINSDAITTPVGDPYAGIWIERINSLTIGYTGPVGGSLNIFHDFHMDGAQGIRSIESNVTVINSTFSNFGFFNPQDPSNDREADAIFARNDGIANKQTTVIGLNQTEPMSPPNTFANCYRDIRTTGTNLTVMDVTSFKSGSSIRATMANNIQNPINCQIKNNKIDYFRGIGIEIGFRKPITINIENNKIFDNDAVSDQPFRYGISINNSSNAEIILKGSRIFNNEIRSRSMVAGGNFWGIAIYKGSYLTIEQNNIFDNLAQTSLFRFNGIRTVQSPCNGLRILYNNINGAKIDYTEASGVHLSESLNSILTCNSTDNTNLGMLFLGNCNNADIGKNQFHYHGKGLSLGDVSIPGMVFNQVGPQSKKENRWHGTNSPIEAFALNQTSALTSIFEINSSSLNSIFWPLPRKIGTVDDNFVWFLPATTGPEANENVLTCYITYPGPRYESKLAGTDVDLLNGIYQPPLDYPAIIWEAKWEFADRLNRNPELQNIDNDVAQYYQSTYNDTYSSLNRVYQGHLNRWQHDSPLTTEVENQTTLLNDAIMQRFALDALLSENAEENSALHSQMLNADAVIETKTTSLKSAVENLNIFISQQVNTLITEVNNIVCSESYETDMKDVLKILLLSHLTEGVLTGEQTTRISEIANKCRYSGGYVVLLARGFLEPEESYVQDASCDPEQRTSQIGQTFSGNVFLFPNPAKQTLRIQTEELFSSGSVRVFNSQGVLLKHFEMQGQSTIFPVNNMANGIYFLEVQLDGKPGIRKSFVVN